MNFGAKLKSLRLSKGWTQLEFADKINLSKSNVSKYEAGSVEPNLETLIEIAKLFDVSVNYLLDFPDTAEPTSIPQVQDINESEQLLVNCFRNTDEIGKMKIIQLVLNEHDRVDMRLAAEEKKSVPPIVKDKPHHT